ncbi:TOMM precursor leader peptide-binding protein [Actinokineospora auranticolor]|nr:TOMM precursor leader peptide-binding protein [Actinokineospora auranticolor]
MTESESVLPHGDRLPDRPRVRPGVAVLHRRAGEVQFGLDPRRALLIGDLPAPVVAVAVDLTGGRTTAELLAGLGPPDRSALRELLGELTARGVVEDAAAPAPAVASRLLADDALAAWRPVAPLPADRRDAGVEVRGDGRLAVAVACLLAQAGVGHVTVRASGVVTAAEVGAELRTDDVGRARRAAAHDAVRRADPSVNTRGFTNVRPDLVLLTDALVPDPVVVAGLAERGLPHLCVSSRDGEGLVGPLVVPGLSCCVRCLDHHRARADPCWPLVAAQLAGRSQPADLATAHVTAGVAAAQALRAVAWLRDPWTPPPSTWNATVAVDAFAATLRRTAWEPHPECVCRAATRPTYRHLLPGARRQQPTTGSRRPPGRSTAESSPKLIDRGDIGR